MNDQRSNPFAPPLATPTGPPAEIEYAAGMPPRPKSPLVFGWIGVVFGILALLGNAIQWFVPPDPQAEAMVAAIGYSETYQSVSTIAGIFLMVLMLVFSVLLIRRKQLGRKLFNGYAWVTIVWGIVNTLYLLVNFGSQASNGSLVVAFLLMTLIGAAIGLLYPVLGLVFLNRKEVVESLT